MKFALMLGGDPDTLVALGERGYSVIRVADEAAARRAQAQHEFDLVVREKCDLPPVPPLPCGQNVFDRSILESYANGDRHQAALLVDYFLVSAEGILDAIGQALHGNDAHSARVHAHGLSSHCACVGAFQLSRFLGKFEKTGTPDALRAARECFRQTRQAMAGKR